MSGKDILIEQKGVRVGTSKLLKFYTGRAPAIPKNNTYWVMHEYTLDESLVESVEDANAYVLCNIIYMGDSDDIVASDEDVKTVTVSATEKQIEELSKTLEESHKNAKQDALLENRSLEAKVAELSKPELEKNTKEFVEATNQVYTYRQALTYLHRASFASDI
ncbi:hypothetical protein POM88_052980 [Heracleum sosnowskyi]|uniref:NAC domain-containing protein n=1 Tax=Heracleum sosnowskyi TaxID=360622 RepID=A0AAD8GRN1_9APIA|nr:hypothetical protein POM88_052980 [Heracleum sosnowskyi]